MRADEDSRLPGVHSDPNRLLVEVAQACLRRRVRLPDAFRVFDDLGDGYVTSGAFCRAMEAMNLGFTKEQIARMLRRLDSQRLGYVSYRDFVEAVGEAARSLAPRDVRLQQEVDRALDEVSDARLLAAVAHSLHRRGYSVEHLGLGDGLAPRREVASALKGLNLGIPHSDIERLMHTLAREDGLISLRDLAQRFRRAR